MLVKQTTGDIDGDLAEAERTGRMQNMLLFSVGPNCVKTTTRQHPMVVTSNTEITGNVGLILLYSARASHRPYTLSAIMIACWMLEGWKCWYQRNDIKQILIKLWGDCISKHNTVRCSYNAVNFHSNPHERHPIAHPWRRDMGWFCE